MKRQSPENPLLTDLENTEKVWTTTEIRRFLAEDKSQPSAQVLKRLERDPRAGVRKLAQQIRKRWEREERGRSRLRSMMELERSLWASGAGSVAGVDEVGVGPLAGPVVSAAVMFAPGVSIEGVDDSKRLKEQERERLASLIRSRASGIGIGLADVHEIDELNVYQAALLSMRRAVESLPLLPEHVLVDARRIPGIGIPQSSIKKGDQASFSIAAASIIAKTHRDGLMRALDREHPEYGFSQHKGYGTVAHQEAIRRHGVSCIHRKSFLFLEEAQGNYSEAFYQLKEKLARLESEGDLERLETRLASCAPDLEPREYRKLRVLLGRRRQQLRGRDGDG